MPEALLGVVERDFRRLDLLDERALADDDDAFALDLEDDRVLDRELVCRWLE